MVTPILSALLAGVQPVAETAQLPVCTLATPRGDNVRFFLWGDPAPGNIRMSALPGSAWPSGTLVAARRQDQAGTRFDLGGRTGLRLELSGQTQGRAQRAATLFERDNDRETLPLAYGFCQDEQVTADPPEPAPDRNRIGTDSAALDPEQWTAEDCALLLSNGRRLSFRPELLPDGSFKLSSADLWSGRPVTVPMQSSTMNGMSVSSFGAAGTPRGVRLPFVNRSRASVLVRFQELNDPALTGVSGYAICGIRRVTRRPNR